MREQGHHNVSLKCYIPVAYVFYPFPIHFLRIASSTPSNKALSRILNSLQENHFETIDQLLNTSIDDLRKLRSFGEKGLVVIMDLLWTLSEYPGLIMETDKLEPKLRDELDRIKQVAPIKRQFLELGIEI